MYSMTRFLCYSWVRIGVVILGVLGAGFAGRPDVEALPAHGQPAESPPVQIPPAPPPPVQTPPTELPPVQSPPVGEAGQASPEPGVAPVAPAPVPDPEVLALLSMVDEYSGGAAAPLDFTFGLSIDFFKGALGKTYAPFTISLDRSSLQTGALIVYVRVVEAGSTADAGTAESAESPAAAQAGDAFLPLPAFEDVHFVQLPPGNPSRISRAFGVSPGVYDAYVGVRERGGVDGVRSAIAKQSVTVPDLSGGRLATSSVLRIERMGLHATPLPATERAGRPYAMGTMEIVPAWRSTYSTSETMSLFFIVYGASVAPETSKPNVTVDYEFYRTTGGTETFFNRMPRQAFDADTLPPQFDLALGHQLVAERSLPLQSFPAGDYRVEILVSDRVSGQTLTRNVDFTVEAQQ